jgi:hypothetical protein
VQHPCKKRVNGLVTRHIGDEDPRFVLALFEVRDDVGSSPDAGLSDPLGQIATQVEVDVDDMVAPPTSRSAAS